MQLFGALDPSRDVAVLAGAFNPPTVAHLALAQAARRAIGQVLLAMPERFPHKHFDGATLSQRLEMLACLKVAPAATMSGGLFIDMARELRAEAGLKGVIYFVCGRDAAERIVAWDYTGQAPPIDEQLFEYELLVADRAGCYRPPGHLAKGVRRLEMDGSFDDISSTEVRVCLASGGGWEKLVPESIRSLVRTIYLPC